MNSLLTQLFMRYSSPLAALRRAPIVGQLIRWASEKLVPRDTRIWVQIRRGPANGIWLRLNPRTGSDYLQGGGEPAVQGALERHLRPGMTFYDIGANIGFFSLLAARIVGGEGAVVAFEADPEVAERLRGNVEHNHFANVFVEQKAVWSETATVLFARSDPKVSPDLGLGHVLTRDLEGSIPLQAVSLDDFFQTTRPPDFLKCDVEGAEVAVFRGTRQLLKNNRPILLFEMHSEVNRQTLLQEFAALGYDCESLDGTHVLALPKPRIATELKDP